MATAGTSTTPRERPATGRRRAGLAHALSAVLGLLAAAAFAQAAFAGLFLDGSPAWRDWHALNGMVLLPLLALVQAVLAVLAWRPGGGPGRLALAGLGLLLAVVVQSVLGSGGRLAVHVPLGVAILGLAGALLGRARAMARPDPS